MSYGVMKPPFSLNSSIDIALEQKNQPPRLKPNPKHPVKVHVWDAISKNVCSIYIQILESNLPFISAHFPSDHRFMEDDYPKHTSQTDKDFLPHDPSTNGKHLQNYQMNPIENLWHELKEYI